MRNTSTLFRIPIGLSFLTIYVITNYYTGAFTSLVSIPSFEDTITSITDLANSPNMKTLLIKGSSTDEYFMVITASWPKQRIRQLRKCTLEHWQLSTEPTIKKIGDLARQHPERRVMNALTAIDISTIVYGDNALIIVSAPVWSVSKSVFCGESYSLVLIQSGILVSNSRNPMDSLSFRTVTSWTTGNAWSPWSRRRSIVALSAILMWKTALSSQSSTKSTRTNRTLLWRRRDSIITFRLQNLVAAPSGHHKLRGKEIG